MLKHRHFSIFHTKPIHPFPFTGVGSSFVVVGAANISHIYRGNSGLFTQENTSSAWHIHEAFDFSHFPAPFQRYVDEVYKLWMALLMEWANANKLFSSYFDCLGQQCWSVWRWEFFSLVSSVIVVVNIQEEHHKFKQTSIRKCESNLWRSFFHFSFSML